MNDESIWRDEKTGLSMHRHSIAVVSDDGYDFDMPSPLPCNCGNKAYDILLSAMQDANTKKDSNGY